MRNPAGLGFRDHFGDVTEMVELAEQARPKKAGRGSSSF
jgi:hypothetical protein